jgi:hypothetical protein
MAAAMFNFFSKSHPSDHFKARSVGRDSETDRVRAASVLRSIEEALEAAKAEQAGLQARIDDVLARAAVTMGNDSDEYLTRDPEDSRYQDLLGAEIASGQRRLSELAVTIGHFEFLRTAVLARFPNLSLSNPGADEKTA